MKNRLDNPQEYNAGMADIAKVLQEWPLYRKFKYTTVSLKCQARSAGVEGSQTYYFFTMPEEIDLPCPTCGKIQRWQVDTDAKVYDDESIQNAKYICKNCDKASVEYFFSWSERGGEGLFFKVGQFPPLEAEPPSGFKLSSEDIKFYKKALTSRNVSFGVGALAYLRRVLENEMNALLELVIDAARQSGSSEDSLVELVEVKKSGAFEEKARIAGKYLPANLRPGGSNPFDVIVDFASKGLHSESEEECLRIFDKVRGVFEYLFRNLSFSNAETKAYVASLTNLSGTK